MRNGQVTGPEVAILQSQLLRVWMLEGDLCRRKTRRPVPAARRLGNRALRERRDNSTNRGQGVVRHDSGRRECNLR
jgi:hypothetical protein